MSEIDPRYPIGRAELHSHLAPEHRQELIAQIERLPGELRDAVQGLSDADWDRPYREGGWTVRQVVHHIADSHLNAFVRFRLGLTEQTPTIFPYQEALWAQLPDFEATPPEVSIQLLEAVHRRWVDMLRGLPEKSFSRDVFHPEHKRTLTLDELLCIYGWHGRHHIAHIRQALGASRAA